MMITVIKKIKNHLHSKNVLYSSDQVVILIKYIWLIGNNNFNDDENSQRNDYILLIIIIFISGRILYTRRRAFSIIRSFNRYSLRYFWFRRPSSFSLQSQINKLAYYLAHFIHWHMLRRVQDNNLTSKRNEGILTRIGRSANVCLSSLPLLLLLPSSLLSSQVVFLRVFVSPINFTRSSRSGRSRTCGFCNRMTNLNRNDWIFLKSYQHQIISSDIEVVLPLLYVSCTYFLKHFYISLTNLPLRKGGPVTARARPRSVRQSQVEEVYKLLLEDSKRFERFDQKIIFLWTFP